jgi:hypothetical protein
MVFGMIIVTMLVLAAVADRATRLTKEINVFHAETVVMDEIISFKEDRTRAEYLATVSMTKEEIKGIYINRCKEYARETLAIAKERAMKTKLFNTAKISGKIAELAAAKAAYALMPRKRLLKERYRLRQELIALTNKGASYPEAKYNDLTSHLNIVKGLLACQE